MFFRADTGGARRRSRLWIRTARPREFGDEPLLLAKYFAAKWKGEEANVPKVVVGSDRYQAGRFAERTFGPRIHLLDDGFQHRRLARDFDIVLLAPDDADQVLLPVGRLREPLSSLRRADAVVADDAVRSKTFPALPQRIWRIERDIVLPLDFAGSTASWHFAGLRARTDSSTTCDVMGCTRWLNRNVSRSPRLTAQRM